MESSLSLEELNTLCALENPDNNEHVSFPNSTFIQQFFHNTTFLYPDTPQQVWIQFFKKLPTGEKFKFLEVYRANEEDVVPNFFLKHIPLSLSTLKTPKNINPSTHTERPIFPSWLLPAFTGEENFNVQCAVANLAGTPESVKIQLLSTLDKNVMSNTLRNSETSRKLISATISAVFKRTTPDFPLTSQRNEKVHELEKLGEQFDQLPPSKRENLRHTLAAAAVLNHNTAPEDLYTIFMWLLPHKKWKVLNLETLRLGQCHPNLNKTLLSSLYKFVDSKYQHYKELNGVTTEHTERGASHAEKCLWYSDIRREMLTTGIGSREAVMEELFTRGTLETEIRSDRSLFGNQYVDGVTFRHCRPVTVNVVGETIARSHTLTAEDLTKIAHHIIPKNELLLPPGGVMPLLGVMKNPNCPAEVYTAYIQFYNKVTQTLGEDGEGKTNFLYNYAEEKLLAT